MNGTPQAEPARVSPPKIWKYLLGGALTLLVLIPLWTVVDVLVVQPELQRASAADLIRWIGVPAAIVMLLFGARWLRVSRQARAGEQQCLRQIEQVRAQEAHASAEQARREYVLEVIGLGVTLDKHRQGALWDVLQAGNPYASIREQDPGQYDWSWRDKQERARGRTRDALEHAVRATPKYWGVPTFYVAAPLAEPERQPSPAPPIAGQSADAGSCDATPPLFVRAPCRPDQNACRSLEEVFAFFDAHPDLPYVMLASEDSLRTRDRDRPPGASPLIKDGYYVPDMPDAAVWLVLARRERVDPLRPFVWDDPKNQFVREKLQPMYNAVVAMSAGDQDHAAARQPTVAEWLPAAAAFAKRNDIRGTGLRRIDDNDPWAHRPSKDWRPTPWFPIPWNRDQIAAFDRLPTLGFIHRPTRVKFTDEHGNQVKRRDQRQKILEAGWCQALQALPQAERDAAPGRLIVAAGDHAGQLLALDGTLYQYAAQGGPEIDTASSEQFINIGRRLGDAGSATFLVQVAIGVIGAYRVGGASAVIDFRDMSEASIVLVSPPTPAQRAAQKDAHGDVFLHEVEPVSDPEEVEFAWAEPIPGAKRPGLGDSTPVSGA